MIFFVNVIKIIDFVVHSHGTEAILLLFLIQYGAHWTCVVPSFIDLNIY